MNTESFREQYAGKEALLDAVWGKCKEGLTPNECYQFFRRQARDLVVGMAITPTIIHNYLRKRRGKEGHGLGTEAQKVIEHMEQKQRNEGWYYSAACTDDGKLVSLFWASRAQIDRWSTLNECSVFDTTYNTCIGNMKLHMLIAVNDHGHSEILAQSLTQTEALSDYHWIFKEMSFACDVEGVDGRPRVC